MVARRLEEEGTNGIFSKRHPFYMAKGNYVNIPSWHSKGYLGEGLTLFHDDLGQTLIMDVCVDIDADDSTTS